MGDKEEFEAKGRRNLRLQKAGWGRGKFTSNGLSRGHFAFSEEDFATMLQPWDFLLSCDHSCNLHSSSFEVEMPRRTLEGNQSCLIDGTEPQRWVKVTKHRTNVA
jgi:hypothetical protein